MTSGTTIGFVQMDLMLAVIVQELEENRGETRGRQFVGEVDRRTHVAASPETPEPTTATFIFQ